MTEDILKGISNGVPIPVKERWYRTPQSDVHATIFKVQVDRNGDALIDADALDTLLRAAGFWEIQAK